MNRWNTGLLIAVVLAGAVGAFTAQEPSEPPPRWFKGNTHTHTLNSDGDSSPGEVAHWYRDRGYDFLVISDHNYHTSVNQLGREIARENERDGRKSFLLIPGEEVTDSFRQGEESGVPIHVNGVGTIRGVGAQGGESVVDVLQRCVDAIHAAYGLAHVNHPNFHWALSADDLFAVRDLKFFEIFNGHPAVHNFGGGTRQSLEEMWDSLLGRGKRIFGVAVDDAHNFQGEFAPGRSNPGRGWIVVRARALESGALLAAMRRGDFYCSTGVELEDLESDGGELALRIRQHGHAKYRTYFVGEGGKALAMDSTLTPAYRLAEGEPYVRARVASSDGSLAWTQPLFAE